MSKMKWTDVPQFPRAFHAVEVSWTYIEKQIANEQEVGLDLTPDFQRAHVWTMDQRRAYIEYSLRGGEVGRTLTFGCYDWNKSPVPGYVILDGKQRLETVRMFLRGEIRVFPKSKRPEGYAFGDFEGRLLPAEQRFRWQVVVCKTRAAMLETYLNINAGGTPHSAEELERVRSLLEKETSR